MASEISSSRIESTQKHLLLGIRIQGLISYYESCKFFPSLSGHVGWIKTGTNPPCSVVKYKIAGLPL